MILALLTESQPNGTQGGDFNSGAWRVRQLNTIQTDLNSLIALPLAAGVFRLNPAYYYFDGQAWATTTSRHQTRLFNVTAGAVALNGESAFAAAPSACTPSRIRGAFRVTVPTDFQLEHQAEVTQTINGMGISSNFGLDNVFASLAIYVIGYR